jgi:hypothetical protein
MVKNRFNSIINKKRRRKAESENEVVRKTIEELEKEEEPTQQNGGEEKLKEVKVEAQGKGEEGRKEEAEPQPSTATTQRRNPLQKYPSADCPLSLVQPHLFNRSISLGCLEQTPSTNPEPIEHPPSSVTLGSMSTISPLPGLSGQLTESYFSNDKKR